MSEKDGPRYSIDPHHQDLNETKWGWTIYHPNGDPSGVSPKHYYNRDLAIKSLNHHLRNCLHLTASKIYGDPD